MSTILFDAPIYGPVRSRRLGLSLGVNLAPADGKICSFNCIYCECGLNEDHRTASKPPTAAEISTALDARLRQLAASASSWMTSRWQATASPRSTRSFRRWWT